MQSQLYNNENNEVRFTARMSELKRKIRATAYAVDRDSSYSELSTIRVTVEADQIMMVATNRKMIIATRQEIVPDTETITGEMLLDSRALKYLSMMPTTYGGSITVTLWKGRVAFVTDDEMVTVAHAHWDYPAIDDLLVGLLEAPPEHKLEIFDPYYLETMAKSFQLISAHAPLVVQGTASKNSTGKPGPVLFYGAGEDDWVAVLQPMVAPGASEGIVEAAKDAFASVLNARIESGS